jgi:hypothetical protein
MVDWWGAGFGKQAKESGFNPENHGVACYAYLGSPTLCGRRLELDGSLIGVG